MQSTRYCWVDAPQQELLIMHTAAVGQSQSLIIRFFNGRDIEQLICQGTIHLCISEISEQADCHSHQGSDAYIRQKLMTKPNLTVKR